MFNSRRGEVATILAISAFIVLTVTTIATSIFVNQDKKTTNSKASGRVGTCAEFETLHGANSSDPLPGQPGHKWVAHCDARCTDTANHSDCQSKFLGKAVWCYGFEDSPSCLSLEPAGTGGEVNCGFDDPTVEQRFGACGCVGGCRNGANVDYACCHREWTGCQGGSQRCATVRGAGNNATCQPEEMRSCNAPVRCTDYTGNPNQCSANRCKSCTDSNKSCVDQSASCPVVQPTTPPANPPSGGTSGGGTQPGTGSGGSTQPPNSGSSGGSTNPGTGGNNGGSTSPGGNNPAPTGYVPTVISCDNRKGEYNTCAGNCTTGVNQACVPSGNAGCFVCAEGPANDWCTDARVNAKYNTFQPSGQCYLCNSKGAKPVKATSNNCTTPPADLCRNSVGQNKIYNDSCYKCIRDPAGDIEAQRVNQSECTLETPKFTSFTCVNEGKSVTLKWTDVVGAKGYRGSAQPGNKSLDTNSSSSMTLNIDPGVSYRATVKAIGGSTSFKESAESPAYTFKCDKCTGPGQYVSSSACMNANTSAVTQQGYSCKDDGKGCFILVPPGPTTPPVPTPTPIEVVTYDGTLPFEAKVKFNLSQENKDKLFQSLATKLNGGGDLTEAVTEILGCPAFNTTLKEVKGITEIWTYDVCTLVDGSALCPNVLSHRMPVVDLTNTTAAEATLPDVKTTKNDPQDLLYDQNSLRMLVNARCTVGDTNRNQDFLFQVNLAENFDPAALADDTDISKRLWLKGKKEIIHDIRTVQEEWELK